MPNAECRMAPPHDGRFVHALLDSGVEFAADPLPRRHTVALGFRVLVGVVDDPPDRTGIGTIVERTLSKGTERYDGRGLADAFDRLGIQWSSMSGRQSMLVRLLCLPEFALEAVDLAAEMIAHPTFPDDACRVAVELALQELKQIEDEPDEVARIMIQRLALGPTLGRHTLGTPETLANITPDSIRGHWKKLYSAGRLQVAAAGPVDADALIRRLEERFDGFGERTRTSRGNAPVEFRAQREHRHKELEQEYINLALPGAARESPDFAVEQVLIGILAGGMSGRLFTEVREKQGLVYSVSAWHEQPRGKGIIHLSASTTPERCPRTYETLLRELQRLSEDLTESETLRARNSLLAHHQTEDDLTRARAGGLSDDLFYFGRPIGTPAKMEAIRAVTMAQVEAYVRRLPRDQVCVATLGPRDLD